MRSTMTVLDSNIRIDGPNNRRVKPHVAVLLTALSGVVRDALRLVARFITSRYEPAQAHIEAGSGSGSGSGSRSVSGAESEAEAEAEGKAEVAQGDLSLRAEMEDAMARIRRSIRAFVDAMDAEVRATDHLSVVDDVASDSRVLGDNVADQRVPVDREEASRVRFNQIPLTYNHVNFRSTLKSWYKLHPLRVFCALLVQVSMQAAALLHETVQFIYSLQRYRSLHISDGCSGCGREHTASCYACPDLELGLGLGQGLGLGFGSGSDVDFCERLESAMTALFVSSRSYTQSPANTPEAAPRSRARTISAADQQAFKAVGVDPDSSIVLESSKPEIELPVAYAPAVYNPVDSIDCLGTAKGSTIV